MDRVIKRFFSEKDSFELKKADLALSLVWLEDGVNRVFHTFFLCEYTHFYEICGLIAQFGFVRQRETKKRIRAVNVEL